MKIDPTRIEVIDDQMAAIWRSKTGAERIAIANGMIRSVRQVLESHLKSAHPEWTPGQLSREVGRRIFHGLD